ncbi:MAG: hypothetical protein ABUK01_01145 [Leptospirales bacterium]
MTALENLIENDINSVKARSLLISELIDQGKIRDKAGKSLLDFWSLHISESETDTSDGLFNNFIFQTAVSNCLWGVYLIELPTRSMVYKFSPDEDPLLIKVLDAALPNEQKKPADSGSDTESTEPAEQPETNGFRLYTLDLEYSNKKYMLAIVSLVVKTDVKVLEKIKNIFNNFYFLTKPPKDVHLIDYFKLTSKDIMRELAVHPKGQSVTFIYFHFEPLKKYVKYGGDYFAQEVVDHIKTNLYENFSKDAICYALTLRKYLLVCPGLENELVGAKLKKLNFHLKQIILTYKVNYFTASPPIKNLEIVWEKLNTK